ncbi:putative inactive receptor kinase [Hordeum vulgare]|nr:putative inactive receptor kinase [Hordeum vulgare]
MASAAALLLAAAVVVLLACLALADPPAREQSALLAILAATLQERKLGWSASTPACAWVGVTCDAANSTVIKLRLPGVGLVGPIPPSTISRLTNLQDNAISGAIPPGVSGLAALERLVLSHNNLSGPIPFELRLDGNRQSGKIPSIANPGLNTTG